MRIGYLVSQYPAPSHTFIRREIAALRRKGLEVATFSVRPGEALTEDDHREQRSTFTVLPVKPWDVARTLLSCSVRRPGRWAAVLRATVDERLAGQFLRSCAYFAEAMRLAQALEMAGVTHVHNHFANPAAAVGLAAARYLGIPWSCTLHGLSDFAGPTTPLLPRRIAAASFVACATHYGRAQVLRVVPPEQWGKVHVVRCGIDLSALPPPGPRCARPGEPLQLLTVGRLAPEKGHLGLLIAFQQLLEAGVHARLTIVGGGSERERLEGDIRARGLGDRVELAGAQPERAVFDAMARADVFVMSSFMEGLPVVLMEALALEVPVVAPQVAGIPELVTDGETGLLFEVGNWHCLGERLVTLCRETELRARLARAGRRRVLAEFDVDRSVEPLVDLFSAALS